MCLYPKLIRNRKYEPNKKNGWQAPAVSDTRTLHVPIGCQICMECRKRKARDWQVRLLEEIKTEKKAHFITLTFNTQALREIKAKLPTTKTVKRVTGNGKYKEKTYAIAGYNLDNAIAKYAVRHFLENWRKKYKRSLRHWFVTELGHTGTEHVHLHGIVWTDEPIAAIKAKWIYGYTWTGKETVTKDSLGISKFHIENYVNEKTVSYIVKYMTKVDLQHKNYKSLVLASPGIGSGYTKRKGGDHERNKFKGAETNETYRTKSGHKISLPIYYRNKIYTDADREALWLVKLDKQERWICGERIDITTTDRDYYKLLTWYQEKNNRLGYGNNQTWRQNTYENQRREMIYQQRLMPNGYPIEWDN